MTVNKPTHKNMKIRSRNLLPALLGSAALGLSTLAAMAQDGPPPPPPPPHHGHPPSPLFEALDTNHDGVLSADEIKNAATSLGALDKNKDGQLTADEMRPVRPEGADAEHHGRGPEADADRHGPGAGPGAGPEADEPRWQHRHGGPEARDDRRPAPPADAESASADRPGPGPGHGPGPREDREGAGPERHGPRPMPPVMAALDANHDGVISADEMKNAQAALKTLDKNNDGQLTPDEMRPARGPRPAGGRESGPDGAKAPRPPVE